MKIQIRDGNVTVSAKLRAHVERRLGLALGRFGEKVGRIAVRFDDVAGAKGETEKKCRVIVNLPRSVRIAEVDVDAFVAIDRASDRAARAIARLFDVERLTN